MCGDGNDTEPVLVLSGVDAFRACGRQSHLLFAGGALAQARTHPRRNVLQKALGGGNQFVDPQLGAVGTESGDRFLICSDGLTEGLYDHHVADLMRSAGPSGNPARALVEASVELDGKDNTTAVVIEVI